MVYKEDIEAGRKASIINSEIETLKIKINDTSKRILSLENQLRSAGLAFTVAFIIFFFIRYLFYSIKWSIRTLKQKTE